MCSLIGRKIEKGNDVHLFFDEIRSNSQNPPRQILILGAVKYYFFINTTSENSFEILYTALVPCGHEDELNWNKWIRRPAG